MMRGDVMLRRKWTFRAHGKQAIFVKRRNERASHVLSKAFLWALYLPSYPELKVEFSIGDRFKPDVVAVSDAGAPVFWGEAGMLGITKMRSLLRRYRTTHFAIAKWDTSLDPFIDIASTASSDVRHQAPIDLLNFPPDSGGRFIDDQGTITIVRDDIEWIRLG
jgi:hypothetical protein